MSNRSALTLEKITSTLPKNYMPYAMSVIVSRAIPEIDGFKPSHRKLLYTMYKMNLLNGNRTKSANVVGQTMKLNPHGDAAIYETMVRLTEGNEALLHPLVDSKGNFGKQYSRDMAYAAARYTEVKLSQICEEIFSDIDKDTVDFIDNYDNTMKEPALLPTSFPNILVNPNQGIAVGMASNICSFNLREVCKTVETLIDDPAADIVDILKAPDFSTGGEILYDRNIFHEIYEIGRGSFKIRSKYRYVKAANCIEIYEIPYTTSIEVIIEKIVELIKISKIREISDIRDESDLKGLKIAIDLKRGVDPDKFMQKLFASTTLEDFFGCNFNVLINGSPAVLGVRAIILEWIKFRASSIKRSTQFDIEKKSERLHLLEGLEKILLDIDKAVEIVRKTKEESKVLENLMAGFLIDKIQAEFVAEIRLKNLNEEYIIKKISEIKDLKKEIADLKSILASDEKIKDLIKFQVRNIAKKYGKDRKSTIVYDFTVSNDFDDFEDDYKVWLIRTDEGYIKKIPLTSFRSTQEQKLKDDDFVVQGFEASNKSEVLLFSNMHSVYKIKASEFQDSKSSQMGVFASNFLSLDKDEKIIYMVATEKFDGFLIFCFENGKMAKIPLESYKTKLNRKKLINAYSNVSALVKIIYLKDDAELVARSSNSKLLIFDSASIPLKSSKSSQGVRVLSLRKGTKVFDVKLVSDCTFIDPNYYKTKNIPAAGKFLRKEDNNVNSTQIDFGI
jgi:DNA gyrase subunit A